MFGISGSDLAAVGALTGSVAVVWNIGRALRDGPRLLVEFFALPVYSGIVGEPPSLEVGLTLVNAGRTPLYVAEIGTTKKVPWQWSNLVTWLMPQVSTRRRVVGFLFRNLRTGEMPTRPLRLEDDLCDRLDVGELVQSNVDLDQHRLRRLIDSEPYVVVWTGRRTYVRKLSPPRLD
jgi:hypothetical protein